VRRVALSIAGVTLGALVFFALAGIPLFGVLYGIDFESMRVLCLLMIVAGGFTGGIDFLYQVMTVVRNQNAIIRSYLVAFVVALCTSVALVFLLGLPGAVFAYLATMAVLFFSLVVEYLRVARRGSGAGGDEGGEGGPGAGGEDSLGASAGGKAGERGLA
jgi:O-antigen/teichoic acid export membrane protein